MSAWDTWLGRIKTVLEIVAIPVAAYWAFTRFLVVEAPALEYRTDAIGELRWYARTASGCIGEYTAAFRNIGKTSIDVTGGRIRIWLLSPKAPEESVTYIDPQNMREGKPTVEHDVTNDVKGRYSPDVSSRVNFAFRMKRNPGQIVLFAMEGEAVDSRGQKHPWSTYRLGYVCGDSLDFAVPPEPSSRK